jgi:hypothetical protein
VTIQGDSIADQPVTDDTAVQALRVQRFGKRGTVGKNTPRERAAFAIFIGEASSEKQRLVAAVMMLDTTSRVTRSRPCQPPSSRADKPVCSDQYFLALRYRPT